ncbi:MAG: hypothetical protein PHI12_06965 [Dehalococcoidales bacterium]|nr:hypothetical protein [Dehalococcoidales bacterium]
MATLPSVLVAQTGVPSQIEAKFTMLPKLSTMMSQFASMLPAGPDLPLPAQVTTAPTLPALPDIFTGPALTGSRATRARADYMGPQAEQNRVIVMPGQPPIGLQTQRIPVPIPAGQLTNTVVTRRGV